MKASSKGFTLVTVLAALFALSALAVSLMVSSRSEVVGAGLEQQTMHSLQVADAALNYTLGVPENFAATVDQPPMDLRAQGEPFDATVAIDYQPPPRLPPPGFRVSALKAKSFHFLMSARGMVKSKAPGEPDSSTSLEMEVGKLGPASNE